MNAPDEDDQGLDTLFACDKSNTCRNESGLLGDPLNSPFGGPWSAIDFSLINDWDTDLKVPTELALPSIENVDLNDFQLPQRIAVEQNEVLDGQNESATSGGTTSTLLSRVGRNGSVSVSTLVAYGEYFSGLSASSGPMWSGLLQAALVWMQRGFAWYSAFNHAEASRCFRQAAIEQPDSPFPRWALALAHGPNYNVHEIPDESAKLAYKMSRMAIKLLEEAEAKAGSNGKFNVYSDVERALIMALAARYTWPQGDFERRKHLDLAYRVEMQKIYEECGRSNSTVTFLFAEAVMQCKSWCLWYGDRPSREVEISVQVLERGLAIDPVHPGLLHLYIHALEMGPRPQDIKWAADRLRMLVPDAGHLLHMPSHVDILIGDYDLAIEANEAAIRADHKYVSLRGLCGEFYDHYRAHNIHFVVYAAMFVGKYGTAIKYARKISDELPEETVVSRADRLEYFYSLVWHVLIRFGKWDAILDEPLPIDADLYCVTNVTARYARALAFASLNRLGEAAAEQQLFVELYHAMPRDRMAINNTAYDTLAVAKTMLEGEIAYRGEEYDHAFQLLSLGVQLDDSLVYDEPWGWMQPVRHALGALLLERGHVERAFETYKQDLAKHPKNVWALQGIVECCERLRLTAEGAKWKELFEVAKLFTDVSIVASCYCRFGVINS